MIVSLLFVSSDCIKYTVFLLKLYAKNTLSGLLRTTINKLKQDRCITPKLLFIRGGQDDASIFENFLIEEQDVDGSGLTSVMGFVSFLEDVTQKVLEFVK